MHTRRILDTADNLSQLAAQLRSNPDRTGERLRTYAAAGFPTRASGSDHTGGATTPPEPADPNDPECVGQIGDLSSTERAALTPDQTAVKAVALINQLTQIGRLADRLTIELEIINRTSTGAITCRLCTTGRIKPGSNRCNNPKCSAATHGECVIDECAKIGDAGKGLCSTHYQQKRRAEPGRRKGTESRLFDKPEQGETTQIGGAST